MVKCVKLAGVLLFVMVPAAGAAFVEVTDGAGRYVCMEAENCDSPASGWEAAADATAGGSRYMAGTQGKCASCTMDFPVRFNGSGYYRVYLRCSSTGNDDNDAYITLDGTGGWVFSDGQ